MERSMAVREHAASAACRPPIRCVLSVILARPPAGCPPGPNILHQLARSAGIQQDCNRMPTCWLPVRGYPNRCRNVRHRRSRPLSLELPNLSLCDDGHQLKTETHGRSRSVSSGFSCLRSSPDSRHPMPRLPAGSRTFDGKHDHQTIDLTVVYLVPKDRTPLPDWRERVDYFMKRIEAFHRRESAGRSTLHIQVHPRAADHRQDGDGNPGHRPEPDLRPYDQQRRGRRSGGPANHSRGSRSCWS